MKSLAIIVLTLLSLFFNKQEPISRVATVKLPSELVAKKTSEVLEQERTLFERGPITASYKKTYKRGNIFFGFTDKVSKGDYDLNRAVEAAYDQPELRKSRNESISASLVQYKNIKVAVSISFIGDEGAYYFISETNKDGHGISGAVVFKKTDEIKARKIMDDFLNSFKFKE